jgi:peptidoglycan/LPS O-acetylase OafA/YrhL
MHSNETSREQADQSTAPQTASLSRLIFADNLRTALVILVVLHHLAVIYGANIGFYYVEPAYSQVLVLLLLVIFQLLNQAYFMGFFFLISGYFTPGSFEHKGLSAFLKDRLIRLGIPLLAFMFVLNPLTFYVGAPHIDASLLAKGGITLPLKWQDYIRFIGPGPLWFVAMLLVFDFTYAAWRVATRNRPARSRKDSSLPNYRMIVVYVLALALASYLVRIVVPIATYVLSFPTLAYLPQYLSFFAIGIIAYRRNWLRTIPSRMGKLGFGVALVATLTLFPVALRGGADFLGGGFWQSAFYSLWDSTFAVGMVLGLITLFRRRFDYPSRLGRFLSQHSYAVFVIHIPVIVSLAVAMQGIHLEQLLKFGLAAIIGVPLCFGAAYLVRKIPLADRVL